MKRFLKENKGITLVALVITIIILIILAGVTFSVVLGQNGLIEKSKDGVTRYKDEATRERIQLAVINASMGDNGITENSLRTALNNEFGENGFILQKDETSGNFIITVDSVVVEVTPTGSIITSNTNGGGSGNGNNGGNGGQQQEDNGPYARYSIGDEVTVTYNGKTESFYVLESSNSNNDEVTLFAKFCLKNSELTQDPYEPYEVSEIRCEFTVNGDDEYWYDEFQEYLNDSNRTTKFNINNVSGESEGDAIYKAKQYATLMGGTNGRLITFEEVNSLLTGGMDLDYIDKSMGIEYINADWAKAVWGVSKKYRREFCEAYWLGSCRDNGSVYYINGYDEHVGAIASGYDDRAGVRPVITVSKSLVQRKVKQNPEEYNFGQEVQLTYNGITDNFYVLEDNQNSLTLLAKYCLNSSDRQINPVESFEYDMINFASKPFYWGSAYIQWYNNEQINDPYNENIAIFDTNQATGSNEGDALTRAKNYATSMGATSGRLLTYEEWNQLLNNSSTEKIAWGNSDEQQYYCDYFEYEYSVYPYMDYWLSSTEERLEYDMTESEFEYPEQIEFKLYAVAGVDEYLIRDTYYDNYYGIRPVITVPKTANIQICLGEE